MMFTVFLFDVILFIYFSVKHNTLFVDFFQVLCYNLWQRECSIVMLLL